jgi:hypothetical protein
MGWAVSNHRDSYCLPSLPSFPPVLPSQSTPSHLPCWGVSSTKHPPFVSDPQPRATLVSPTNHQPNRLPAQVPEKSCRCIFTASADESTALYSTVLTRRHCRKTRHGAWKYTICRGESEMGMLIEIGIPLSLHPGPECFTANALKKEFHIHPSRYHVVKMPPSIRYPRRCFTLFSPLPPSHQLGLRFNPPCVHIANSPSLLTNA